MERRNYPRVKTCNLISYIAIRENGEIIDIGMGRALDISQNGIFLETPRLLFSEYISLMSTDLDNNLIEIKGKVIYSGVNRSGMIGNGIRLQGEHHENIQFAARLIKVFHTRKNKFAPAMAVQK
jgi:PilZ domain